MLNSAAVTDPLRARVRAELPEVEEIGDPAEAKAWFENAVAQKKKIMGLGHRVYKVKDPRAHALQAKSDLSTDSLFGLSGFALLLGFADTENGRHACRQHRLELSIDITVGLVEELAPLGVTDDHMGDGQLFEHGR